ncbi:DUF6427 family protein [Psychroflexus aestuariivivens]|uniref:DUF6427 family protein n=1 Tax=Psychroflexus aestuariivivens TaxID=1795040 RepID=UPI000FDABAC5|nr:DUF6427 family protein [Psychroflexus aestuariivivens]
MITRFFNHSKPIAYILVSLIFGIAFFFENFISLDFEFDSAYVLRKIGIFIVFLLLLFVLNFILKRNKIQKQNTYTLSIFVLLLIAFPEVLRAEKLIISYIFLLFAVRRIISLKNNKFFKQRIFDAGFCLFFASVLEPSHLLFAVVIYYAILLYASQNYRYFILPILGFLVGLVLHTTYMLITEDQFVNYIEYLPEIRLESHMFADFKYGFLLVLNLLFLIWSLFQMPKVFSQAKLHQRKSLNVFNVILVISLVILIFNHRSFYEDALYFVLPISIFMGNYFQLKTTKTYMKEIIYALMIIGILVSALY